MNEKDTALVTASEAGELARAYPYAPDIDPMRLYEVDPSALAGACDRKFTNLDSRLVPWRFATFFVRATRIAGPPVAYQIAASQTFSIFGEGEGDPGAGSGISNTLTNVETNAQKGGGLVQNDQLYFTVGMGVTILQPFAVAVATPPSIATKISLPEVDDPVNGYGRRLMRAVAQNFAGIIQHGTGACDYKIGPIDSWGSAVQGGDAKTSDAISGQFWYIAVPDVSTGAAQSNALEMVFDNPRTVQVRENALNPIPVELDVLIPVRVSLFGFPACAPGRTVAGGDLMRALAGMNPAERREFARMLAQENMAGVGKGNGG